MKEQRKHSGIKRRTLSRKRYQKSLPS